jgi:hypothetical protein
MRISPELFETGLYKSPQLFLQISVSRHKKIYNTPHSSRRLGLNWLTAGARKASDRTRGEKI